MREVFGNLQSSLNEAEVAAREAADAAREAGLQTVLVDRLDDYPQPRHGDATNGHRRVESFAEVTIG